MQFGYFPSDHMLNTKAERRRVPHHKLDRYEQKIILQKTRAEKHFGQTRTSGANLYGSGDTAMDNFALKLLRSKGKKERRESSPVSNFQDILNHKSEYLFSMANNGQHVRRRVASDAGTPIPNSPPPRKESITSYSVPIPGSSLEVPAIGDSSGNQHTPTSSTQASIHSQIQANSNCTFVKFGEMLYSIPEYTDISKTYSE
ncbi:hypothetical protein K7432_006287, partial [Basidiobolus ranarum]